MSAQIERTQKKKKQKTKTLYIFRIYTVLVFCQFILGISHLCYYTVTKKNTFNNSNFGNKFILLTVLLQLYYMRMH